MPIALSDSRICFNRCLMSYRSAGSFQKNATAEDRDTEENGVGYPTPQLTHGDWRASPIALRYGTGTER